MILGYIDPATGFTLVGAGSGLLALWLAAAGIFLLFLKKIRNFFKKHWRFVIIALIIVCISIAALIMMNIWNKKSGQFDHKVIILGFDGLSPTIVERMMREGKLPHFSALKEKGSYSPLATTNPAQSPVAWAGFATGKNPGKHGIFDFIVRDPKDYQLRLSLSNYKNNKPQPVLKAKGFWWYMSKRKVPTILLGAPMTFPPEKIHGRMLSGMGVPDILGTEGTFSYYTTEQNMQEGKSEGGQTFHISRENLVVAHLIGPRFVGSDGSVKKAKVPFKIEVHPGKGEVTVQYQDTRVHLTPGVWSDWQTVGFDVGQRKKAHGIFKFYLTRMVHPLGLYVSPINFDPHKPLFPISYPSEYSAELADALGSFYYTLGIPFETWGVNEEVLAEKPFLEQVNATFIERNKQLAYELERFEQGVLFSYYGMPDAIQHMFWRYIDPNQSLNIRAEENEIYQKTIEEWYQQMDEVLGRIFNVVGPEDSVSVLSDHGFDRLHSNVHVNTWLMENGYLVLNNPDALMGGPLFADVDWSKTKAYAIGFGGIYINQKGRERDGGVAPGGETDHLKSEIIAKMSEWVDGRTKDRVVHKVYRREEIFSGDHVDDAPDLFIGFNIGFQSSWQTALGEVPNVLLEANPKKYWSGTHLFDPAFVPGIVLTNKKITKSNPTLYDMTPTILKLIGYTDAEIKKLDFDGSPLFE
jgi:predicted AlkP superfamily phosphohydrolase/phosphomutase